MTRATPSPARRLPVRAATVVAAALLPLALVSCGGDDAPEGTAAPAASAPAAAEDAVDAGTAPPAEPSAAPAPETAPAPESAPAPDAPGGPASPEAPSGAVPEGWEVVGDPAALGLALPAGFQTQELDLVEGVDSVLHAVDDGTVLVSESTFTGALAGSLPPEQNLENAVVGAIQGGQLEGVERSDLTVAGRPGAQLVGQDATGARIVARYVADGDSLLGVIVTGDDPADNLLRLDEVWDTVRLP